MYICYINICLFADIPCLQMDTYLFIYFIVNNILYPFYLAVVANDFTPLHIKMKIMVSTLFSC